MNGRIPGEQQTVMKLIVIVIMRKLLKGVMIDCILIVIASDDPAGVHDDYILQTIMIILTR